MHASQSVQAHPESIIDLLGIFNLKELSRYQYWADNSLVLNKLVCTCIIDMFLGGASVTAECSDYQTNRLLHFCYSYNREV